MGRHLALLGLLPFVLVAAGLACGDNVAVKGYPPSPAPSDRDAKVRQIFFADDAIKAMVAGRELGRDYWIVDVAHFTRPFHGSWESMVVMVFAEPVSYSGELPTASNPCEGHYGEDEQLDEDDPCLNEPRQYGTKPAVFSIEDEAYARVDITRGEVVEVLGVDVAPDILEDEIEYAKQQHIWEPTPPATTVPP